MSTASIPTLAQSLASLVQSQLAQMHNNPNLPKYDYSNLDSSVIDPNAYASSAANAQYDPQIAALQHQLSNLPGQNTLDLSNITDWYNHAQNTYDAGAVNASKQYDNAAQALAGSAAGFISAMGGSANAANPGVANQALIQQGMLAGNRQADVNLDTSMGGLIPLAAAQAKTNQQSQFNKAYSDLQSQLGSTKSAKGAYRTSEYQNAMGKRFDQLSGIDKLKSDAAQNLFNNQMSRKAANTSTASTAMNAIIAARLAGPQVTAAKLANDYTRSKISATKAQQNLLKNGVNLADPGQAKTFDGLVRGAITHSVVDANGNSKVVPLYSNPRKAWSVVMGVLSRYKGTNSPQGVAFAKSIFKDYLPKGWSIDNSGKLHGPNDWINRGGSSSESTVRNASHIKPSGKSYSSPQAKPYNPPQARP